MKRFGGWLLCRIGWHDWDAQLLSSRSVTVLKYTCRRCGRKDVDMMPWPPPSGGPTG